MVTPFETNNSQHDVALSYANRHFRIFPRLGRVPLIKEWPARACHDPAQVAAWWREWPHADIGLATGIGSGVVVVDIDRHGSVDGFDSLEVLGVPFLPATAMVITPHDGCHLFFKAPAEPLRSCFLACGVELKAEFACVTLPPQRGRYWDPTYDLGYSLAPLPAWAYPPAVAQEVPPPRRPWRRARRLGAGIERMLLDTGNAIVTARDTRQYRTLNDRAFRLGALAARGVVPEHDALDLVETAARHMPTFDRARPWRRGEAEKIARAAFRDGLRRGGAQ